MVTLCNFLCLFVFQLLKLNVSGYYKFGECLNELLFINDQNGIHRSKTVSFLHDAV